MSERVRTSKGCLVGYPISDRLDDPGSPKSIPICVCVGGGGDVVVRIIHQFISYIRSEQKRPHPMTFSLEPSPLKLDNARLTFAMTFSVLHIVLPHGPRRRSLLPTVLLSSLTTSSPPVHADPPPPSRARRRALPVTWPSQEDKSDVFRAIDTL